MTEKKSFLVFFAVLLPVTFSWLYIASIVLIYSNDIITSPVTALLFPDIDLIYALILLIGIPVVISIIGTGVYIDKYPHQLGKITTTGLMGSSILLGLYVISFQLLNGLLLIFIAFFLGLFMGTLTISSHTFFGSIIKWDYRGRYYSIAIFGYEVLSLILILGIEILNQDFLFAFSIYAILGLGFTIIFYYCTRNWNFWANDPWPTRNNQILNRPSVNAYFWTHIMVYLMIGLILGNLAEAAEFYNINTFFNIELGAYKTFWGGLILGAAVFIIPAGILTDKLGRKTVIILGTYGIVFASIIAGFLTSFSLFFTFSAIMIGVSFALIHPSLDSSLWADLASRDSIGRYYSLGFLSLALGVAIGLFIGELNLLGLTVEEILAFNVFFLITIAVLASFPLFWISDSSPPLYFFLLLIINEAGIPIFNYDFERDDNLKIDLPLISGALSAVGNFMLEATGEKDARLNLVRHGSNFIISDKTETGISGAIFANKNDPELESYLKKFLIQFETKYKAILPSWKGNVGAFNEAVNIAEEIFGPLVTMQVDDYWFNRLKHSILGSKVFKKMR